MSGVKINGTVISLDKNDDAVKKALNSEGGLQAVVKHVYKLESGDELSQHSFVVNFIRPVNLNMPGEISLQDAKTGGDIANFQHNKLLTDWRGEAITIRNLLQEVYLIGTSSILRSMNMLTATMYRHKKLS